MNRHKIISILLITSFALSFAGCSSNTDNTTTTTSKSGTEAGTETSASTETTESAASSKGSEASKINEFFIKINYLEGFDTFELSSADLSGDTWADSFSTTTKGKDQSPQLSWAPVEGASSYVIYMLDQFGRDPTTYWKSNDVKETDLPSGWAPKSEYIGPVRHTDGLAHPYVIYVVALRQAVKEAPGEFYNATFKFEDKIKTLDTDDNGKSGNIVAYGRLAGYYAGEENFSDPSEWVKWVTVD